MTMAVDMTLKLKDIDGESKVSGYEGWIDVLAWSWGMSNASSFHHGGGGGSGKVNINDISITKYVDKASSKLMLKACDGTHIGEGTLSVRKAGGDKPVEYLKIKMTDLMVTSVQTGGTGGEDRLTENIGLCFAKVEVTYSEQDSKGVGKPGTPFAWDIPANKKSG
jgi:type VI secretion system secreted protein Hcp